jgi:hypothetical protein
MLRHFRLARPLKLGPYNVQEEDAEKDAELAAKMEAMLEGDADEEERLIEERRKRRQQIVAKHKEQQDFNGTILKSVYKMDSCALVALK